MLPFSKNQQVAYRYLNGKAIALPYGDEPLRRTINTNLLLFAKNKIFMTKIVFTTGKTEKNMLY